MGCPAMRRGNLVMASAWGDPCSRTTRPARASHRVFRRACVLLGALAAAGLALIASAPTASAHAAQPFTPGLWPLAVARWLLFAGLAIALGGLGPRAPVSRYRSGPIATTVGAARVAARPCRERGAGRIGGRWWQPGGRGFRAAAA